MNHPVDDLGRSDSALHVPACDVPIPTSVSSQAQAMLALGKLGPTWVWPAQGDTAAWKAFVAEQDEVVLSMVQSAGSTLAGVSTRDGFQEIVVGGVSVYDITPAGVDADDRRLYFDIHGGAWIQGGGRMCRAVARITASRLGAHVWSVDYRMPPDHPYPTPLDDCVAAYRALLQQRRAEEIVVGGVSAGANLVAGLVLRMRDEGLPLPAAVVLDTGAFDLTESGDSWSANLGLDNVLTGGATPAVLLYANGHDLRHPYLSPLFGDLEDFPPTIITTGTRDLLLSDNVRMHRALLGAGVPVELHVWEAAGHGMFLGMAPEDREKDREIRRFIDEHWAGT